MWFKNVEITNHVYHNGAKTTKTMRLKEVFKEKFIKLNIYK